MKKILFNLLLITPAVVSAGGFQLNLQGLKAAAMGGAFTGLSNDASAVFYNPGAMSSLTGHQFTFGANLVDPHVSVQTPQVANTNQTSPRATPIHFYYSAQLNDKFNFGFLVNNQFGSSSSYEDDWQGRYIIQNISLRTFMFQPTVSYKLHDKISIGAGFVYATGSFSTDKAIPVSSSTSSEGKASLTGSGDGVGYNIGIFSNFLTLENGSKKTDFNLGLSYRSAMPIDLSNGEAEFTNIPVALQGQFPATTGFTSKLTLPQVFTAGLSVQHQYNENLLFTVIYDFNWTGWSSYDTLTFKFDNKETPESKSVKDWQDVVTHRFGLDITYKEKFSIRGGIYIDNSPIKDGFVSPELPDITQTAYTGGFGYKINEKFSIDFSFIRQSAERRDLLLAANFDGNYRRKVNVYGLALNIKLPGKSKSSTSTTE